MTFFPSLSLFQYLKDVAPLSSSLHCFYQEICCHLYLCSSLGNVSYFSSCFKIFFFSLALSNLIKMWLAVVFFMFLVVEICQTSFLRKIIKFGNVSAVLSSNVFSVLPSLIPLETPLHIYLAAWSCPTIEQTMFCSIFAAFFFFPFLLNSFSN